MGGASAEAAAELLFVTALAAQFSLPEDLAPITIAVVDKADAWDQLISVLRGWWQQRQLALELDFPGCDRQLKAIRLLTPRAVEALVPSALLVGVMSVVPAVLPEQLPLQRRITTPCAAMPWRKPPAAASSIAISRATPPAEISSGWGWG